MRAHPFTRNVDVLIGVGVAEVGQWRKVKHWNALQCMCETKLWRKQLQLFTEQQCRKKLHMLQRGRKSLICKYKVVLLIFSDKLQTC